MAYRIMLHEQGNGRRRIARTGLETVEEAISLASEWVTERLERLAPPPDEIEGGLTVQRYETGAYVRGPYLWSCSSRSWETPFRYSIEQEEEIASAS
jgi:hypothetical protein